MRELSLNIALSVTSCHFILSECGMLDHCERSCSRKVEHIWDDPVRFGREIPEENEWDYPELFCIEAFQKRRPI